MSSNTLHTSERDDACRRRGSPVLRPLGAAPHRHALVCLFYARSRVLAPRCLGAQPSGWAPEAGAHSKFHCIEKEKSMQKDV